MSIFNEIDSKRHEYRLVVLALKSQGFRLMAESAWVYCAKDTGITRPGAGTVFRAHTSVEIIELVTKFRAEHPIRAPKSKGQDQSKGVEAA